MIFGKLILPGFGILMSNMSQVQNILLFQGCEKIVLRLHTAGTEKTDTPNHIRSPLISMNTIQVPPDTHQTSPSHPLNIPMEQDMSTDDHRKMYSNSTCQCLWVSGAIFLCLVAFLVVCWHLLPGDVWWVSGGV